MSESEGRECCKKTGMMCGGELEKLSNVSTVYGLGILSCVGENGENQRPMLQDVQA